MTMSSRPTSRVRVRVRRVQMPRGRWWRLSERGNDVCFVCLGVPPSFEVWCWNN
jgi:hypothetical protein